MTSLRYFIEAGGIVYSIAFMIAAVRYLLVHRRPEPATRPRTDRPAPTVAVIYLCCNDIEPEALETLSRLRSDGPMLHILHDDSRDPRARARVDAEVDRLEALTGIRWMVLRRPGREGGKAGVLNYVLERTGEDHEFFVLCDNDSFADDPGLISRTLPLFENPHVAVVQYRNMTRVSPGESGFTAYLAGAIEIFDVFMTGLYRPLWTPFVGHNAMLRTRDVVAAGGFTPGFFADDIDLTVRLNVAGKTVLYRRDLRMSEGHPPNYRSFCLRAQKWSSGCGQIIRTHVWRVLGAGSMSLREKAGFLLFCGFYATQAAMLAYLLLVFIVHPLTSGSLWHASTTALLVGTLVPVSIFAAVAVYLVTEGRSLPFFRTLLACAGTYGSTDFWTMRGLIKGLSGRAGRWIPTNTVSRGGRSYSAWAHFVLGAACLLVPAYFQPELLLFPVTWLFAAKYLFVPAVEEYYRPIIKPELARERRPGRAVPSAAGACLAAMVLWWSASPAGAQQPPRVEIRGERLLIDGTPATIKGVHYSPWRAGTGPGKGFEYPGREQVEPDLDLIAGLGANTILAYDPPGWVADLAAEKRLNVIYVFHVEWWRVAEGKTGEIAAEISSRVSELRARRAIIAWMMGNEAPGWVGDKIGADGLRAALSSLRRSAREADPTRPVCYGNWPLAATLDLDRDMDLLSYNVYPFYPTEVPAAGYGNYIRDRVMPLAAGRPVIISEFGVNTIEVKPARQAEVLRECWQGLLEAGAQGGVVFEFSDEWWKNYDNPVRAPDWWRRADAPEDHLAEDQDPEEHYGIYSADRSPKPAAEAVRVMFGEPRPPPESCPVPWSVRRISLFATCAAIAAAMAVWVRGLKRRRYFHENAEGA